jgi:hypothetical protein
MKYFTILDEVAEAGDTIKGVRDQAENMGFKYFTFNGNIWEVTPDGAKLRYKKER